MTFRAGVVLACLGIVAVMVVWLRTEKRRCRSINARLDLRKVELETERWRLSREVAQRTHPSELRARAVAMGLDLSYLPEGGPTPTKAGTASDTRLAPRNSRTPIRKSAPAAPMAPRGLPVTAPSNVD